MKKTLKFLSSVFLISLIGLVNCHKYETGGSPANGYLVGQYINSIIQSATTGNCAISVNLGSLYAGAIVQGAAASSTNFPQAQYEAVTGSTVTDQGYANYAAVPFNKKYDAFLTDGGTWTATTRGTAIATQKAFTDMFALIFASGVYTSSFTSFNATAAGSVTTFFGYFSDTEKASIAAAFGQIGQSALFGSAALITTQIDGLSTGATAANWGGLATMYAALVSNAFNARLAYANGTALMACARIPRSNCTVGALVTASRDADIASLANTYNTILNTPECRKVDSGTLAKTILNVGAVGLPRDATFLGKSTTVTVGKNVYQNNADGGSEGALTSFNPTPTTVNSILADKAYPKSSALLTIAPAFVTTHPLKSGATPYPTATDGSISAAFYGGSNINVATVESCEALGLGGVGPTPVQATDSLTTINAKKKLSDVKEIVYAFSAGNTAAGMYYGTTMALSSNYTTMGSYTMNDTIACNRQMRKNTPIPAVLGIGTTLPVIDTAYGDGGATSLVTACLYGGTAANRTVQASLLVVAAPTLAGLTSCPAAAATGASSFGATGLTTYTGFPEGQ